MLALGINRPIVTELMGMAAVIACLSTAVSQDGSKPEPSAAANSQSTSSPIPQASLFRDPVTGALYKQEIQSVDVLTTRLQTKMVNRTVNVPQTVMENVQVPQTVYVPRTEYVMEQKIKGRWNPFAEPTYAYEYVPITRWLPQTQMITRQVPTTKMVPIVQQVAVYEPVQSTEKVQRTVVTLVQPGSQTLAYQPPYQPSYQPSTYSAAGNQRPLIASVPILSQQRMLPAWQPGTLLSAPASAFRSIVRAPSMPTAQASYAAPMTVATLPNGSIRDMNQAGMPATLVR